MANKIKIFFLSILIITALGAGCSQTNQEQLAFENPKPALVKKPNNQPQTEKAYLFCKNNGHNVAAKFNNTKNELELFCIFSNNTECDLIAFYENKCGPNSGSQMTQQSPQKILEDLRYCDDSAPAVCGADGNNYANKCVAATQNIKVKHEGLCAPNEQANPLTPKKTQITQSASTNNGSSSSQEKQVEQKTGEPAPWLAMLFNIVETYGPTSPKTFVERCIFDKTTVNYYYSEGCQTCFSVLYNEEGDILCFPNNDITNSCPAYFKKGSSRIGCREIWRDPR
jgi:hypothetical protein